MSFVGDIVSSFVGASATRSAADKQKQASDAVVRENQRQYDQTREDYAPYRQAGYNALTQLAGDINAPVTAAEVMSDPGYQFGLDQGQQALDRKIAASGGRISGASLKAASRYGTDYASTGYNAAYQRRQDRLNRLAAIAGIGQTATGGSAAAGAAASGNISSALQSQGDASAAARLAQGNIWGNAVNSIAALYGRNSSGTGSRTDFRWNDPYRSSSYFAGDEGE